MPTVYLKDGVDNKVLLTADGKVAISTACCCSCTIPHPPIALSLTASMSGTIASNIDLGCSETATVSSSCSSDASGFGDCAESAEICCNNSVEVDCGCAYAGPLSWELCATLFWNGDSWVINIDTSIDAVCYKDHTEFHPEVYEQVLGTDNPSGTHTISFDLPDNLAVHIDVTLEVTT